MIQSHRFLEIFLGSRLTLTVLNVKITGRITFAPMELSKQLGPTRMDPAPHFDLQPTLEGESILLTPLKPDDFESLYAVASDPLIWEQHPEPTRYQRGVFEGFFAGAIASGGALLVTDKTLGKVIGSSR